MQSDAFLDSEATDTLYALALRYYHHEMYAESLNLLTYLLRHDPGQAHYHCAMGKAQHALSRHPVALQSYGRAIKLGMGDADVHFYCSQCLIFLRRYESAKETLELALRLAQRQPDRFRGLINQAGELLNRMNKLLSNNVAGAASPAAA